MCREGHGGHPDEDPSRAGDWSQSLARTVHRGQGYSESSGQGEASQKLQGGKEEESQKDVICALHRGELGFELGSAGTSPRVLPTGHITLPWAMRIHEWLSC